MNDDAARRIVIGLGMAANGVIREDGFDIVVASEVMAILCLVRIALMDLKAGGPHRHRPAPRQDADPG